MNDSTAIPIGEIYSTRAYQDFPTEIRHAGDLDIELMRIEQGDFATTDLASHSLVLGIGMGGDCSAFQVDFGDGRRRFTDFSTKKGIYINQTSSDTDIVQEGTLRLLFAALPYAKLAPFFDLDANALAARLAPLHDRIVLSRAIRRRLLDLWDLSAQTGAADRLAADHTMISAAALLLAEVERPVDNIRSAPRLSPAELANVRAFIDANLCEKISLSDMAQAINRSEFQFARAFRETVGLPPHQYVMEQRLGRVQEMLRQSDEPLAQIAFAAGFSSQAHMTATFSESFGSPPGKYRASLRR